jgi:rare lipoprotein A
VISALRILPPLALALLLAACASAPRRESGRVSPPPDLGAIPDAVPRAEPRSAHGNPPFYDVNGRRYQVLASAGGYVERGVASWYGPDFHGHSTSSGEPYDMYAMTAAHKTLPLPCYARITNLANGRSIVVRINDRGPFVANRIVDLSYTAASRLDIVRTGTAFVELRTVSAGAGASTVTDTDAITTPLPTPPPRAMPAPPPTVTTASFEPETLPATTVALYIQVGAYAEEPNAQRVIDRLQAAGVAHVFSLGSSDARRLRRVRIGPVATVEEFDRLAARLATLGFPDARLATD